MAFRIGKSVMLNFGEDLELVFILVGLSFLLLIGPLLRWYIIGMTQSNFKLLHHYFLEFLPFFILFFSSLFITKDWFDANNKEAIIVFASMLISIYLYFAFYIFLASRILKNVKKNYIKAQQTKSQSSILSWLNLLIIGFVVIWISYFLNILDDTIPYITGPVMYSMVVYFLSFKAFQLKTTDIDGNVFKENDSSELFNQLSKLIVDDKLYLDANLSLATLSKLINRSAHKKPQK